MLLFSRTRTRRWALALALFGAGGVLGISTGARAEDTPAPPAVAKTPTPDDGKTEVHIIGVSAIALERQVGDEWVEVCHAPCDERVPTAAKYRVRGPRIKASEPFSLESRDGSAVLEVTPASDRRHSVGVGLMATGAVLVPIGLIILGYGLATIHGLENLGTLLLLSVTGLGVTLDGLGLLIAGGVVLDGQRPTKVTQPDGDRAANVRRPTWITGLERVPVVGMSFVAPVLSVSF